MDLPLDILHHIVQYLNECDRVSLCLSKVSRQFTEFYGRRRNLTLSHCTKLSSHLIQEIPTCSVFRESIRSLDLSHCYHVPPHILISTITQLSYLEELYVHDTQLQLQHMEKIFQHCQNITKLSTNLIITHKLSAERIEDTSYFHILCPYKNKFSQLTFLKLEVINKVPKCFWLELLQVLGWCKNCTSLQLTIFSTNLYFEEIRDQNEVQRTMLFTHTLFPKLKWMCNLKTFILIKRGCPEYVDLVIEQFLDWLFREVTFDVLEHLWINCTKESINYQRPLPPTLRRLIVPTPVMELHRSCLHLTQVGYVRLSTLDQLIHLRDVTGFYCSDEEFDEFIRLHPMIERLSVKFNGAPYFPEAFELPKLRTLKYESTLNSPDVDIMRTVVNACPSIEELNLSHSGAGSALVLSHLHQLKFLKKLVVNGDEYDPDVFRKIFRNCTHLQSLHIAWHFDPSLIGGLVNLYQLRVREVEAEDNVVGGAREDGNAANECLTEGVDRVHLLQNFFSILPLATSLRELRLHVRVCLRVALEEFLVAAQHCSLLEKLMIIKDEDRRSFQMIYFRNYSEHWDPLNSDVVVRFVSSAQHLIALCLIDECFSQSAIDGVSQRLKNEILPSRPAFWFHIGLQLPSSVDDTIPRIYHESLINPLEAYSVPYNLYNI